MGGARSSVVEVVAELEAVGLGVGARHRTYVGGDYIVGVAERIA